MANLIVCCDGTWATYDKTEGGIPTPTNVAKIHGAVADADGNGIEQQAYYHPGVGTDGGWWNKIVGGGMGAGLDDNIKSAYRWLGSRYRDGDQIFLFGFSRGAYTVRSLAGMISACGLLDLTAANLSDDTLWERVEKVFENYRKKPEERKRLKSLRYHNTDSGKSGAGKTQVHFLGVWDTVGALGIPDEAELLNLFDDPSKHSFHDTELGPIIRYARHAVAMDETRQTFAPTLWTKTSNTTDEKQIWFPGNHSDVGGGHLQTGLSDGALGWMMAEAAACGLAFRSGAAEQVKPDPRGVLHNSVSGIYASLKTRPRPVPFLSFDEQATKTFHASSIERAKNPPLAQPHFWPSRHLDVSKRYETDVFAQEKWNPTGLFLKKGETYRLAASGQWKDASIKCGPGGTDDGKFNPAELFQMAASAWGSVENFYKRLTGNEHADFVMTRRHEDWPWFALIGVISDGFGVGKDGRTIEHTAFLIGDGVEIDVKSDGYLYCYANDAWQMYFNNRGSVRLTVERKS
ncbi:DUF2235 domain-containing protein [Roseibium denhamense]|uniref:Uncharacterized protein, PA2063/DUF2235 family n=1 Tax=Roseibium denhamense TaxID=76305 RepID=A0ABY1PBB8_9HYPH|nr:DUF2235 domain-containing protein [Roseibium denhamense]MTI07354.1 DUF2235 domain-containing protein [Roseibium denhamense]SMP29005.1 Uncharacterized protein, PA2063/DUF2235 family [Roseibium denhamense]